MPDRPNRDELAQRQVAELESLLAEGESLLQGLRSMDLRGHELHGLRPWRTCRFCFRMSVGVFIEHPIRDRARRLKYWLRPVVVRASRRDFVTREWRWSRRSISQRNLWQLARLRAPGAPWIHPRVYALFLAWDLNDGRLPDDYESYGATGSW